MGLGRSADIANGALTSKPTAHLCHVRGSHFLQLLSYLFPIQELINPNNLPYYLGHTTGFSKKVIFAELQNNDWEILTGFSPETVDSNSKVAVLSKRGETAPTLPLDSVCFSIPPLFPLSVLILSPYQKGQPWALVAFKAEKGGTLIRSPENDDIFKLYFEVSITSSFLLFHI